MLLSIKGMLRRALRGAKTIRGAFLLLFSIAVVVVLIGPSLAAAVFMRGRPGFPQFAGSIEPYLPLMLLATCLLSVFTSAGERAIYFSPAEIDFLFPAPFHRRELLVYKLGKTAGGLLFLSLFVSTTSLLYVRSWLSAFIGLLLTFAFLQLTTMASALVSQIVTEQAYTLARKAILLAVVLLAVLGLAQAFTQVRLHGAAEAAHSFRRSWAGMVLLAPFELLSRVILAGDWFPDLATSASLAGAIDMGLLALVLKLDADYLESAASISQKLYERAQRIKQSGGMALPASRGGPRIHLPCFPWIGGAGPIAWRQLLLAVRTSRQLILTSLVMCAVILVPLLFSSRGSPQGSLPAAAGIGIIIYSTSLFALMLPWGFRGDIEHMDTLKSVPVRPLALAVGELTGGTVLLVLLQLVMLAMLFVYAPASGPLILATAAFAVPFDVLLLAALNFLFLIYPLRLVPATAGDFQHFGRSMLFMLLEMLIVFPCLGIAAGVGAIAYFLCGSSWVAFALAAWLALAAELPPLLFLVSWAFERFDPSTQTPP